MTKARDLANAGTALTSVSATELGYLDGVTSAVQTQMDAKLATSTASTTYQSLANNNAAGKNAIINGDFGIWQRGTSFTLATSTTYIADRWRSYRDGSGATLTASQQTFTPATVSGYEGTYFLRFAQTVAGSGGSYNVFTQPIEDVRTYAGQTITLSFWAKADSSRSLATNVIQNFGSGGSSAVYTSGTTMSLTTSWQRFTTTVANPSISGKTIGTGSYLDIRLDMPVNTTFTIDIWGVQLEAGSVATAFQTATGTKQGELAACQRYYWRTSATGNYSPMGQGSANGTSGSYITIQNPVQMRLISSVEYANLGLQEGGDALKPVTSVTIDQSDLAVVSLSVGASGGGLTQYRANRLLANNNSSAYLAINGEL